MGQQTTLRALDAAIHSGFARAGLADDGTYTPPTPPGGAAVACRVMRTDVTVEEFGDGRAVASTRVELAILRADVAAPARNGTVLVDGVTLTLEAKISEDQSMTVWVVRGG